jgi:hypothetical protein
MSENGRAGSGRCRNITKPQVSASSKIIANTHDNTRSQSRNTARVRKIPSKKKSPRPKRTRPSSFSLASILCIRFHALLPHTLLHVLLVVGTHKPNPRRINEPRNLIAALLQSFDSHIEQFMRRQYCARIGNDQKSEQNPSCCSDNP